MLNRGKWVVIVWIVTTLLVEAASVKATLSTTEAEVGSQVALTLRIDRLPGKKIVLPPLEHIGGIPVEGHKEEHKFTVEMINNKKHINETTLHTVTFTATHSLDIPAMTVMVNDKPYRTKPLHLEVHKGALPSMGSEPFLLWIKGEKRRLRVGESMMLQVVLMTRNDLEISPKTGLQRVVFDGFEATKLGSEHQYRKGEHTARLLNYLLVPQHEGNLTIGPLQAKVGVMDRSKFTFFLTYPTKWHDVHSNRLTIEVLPKPQGAELVGDFSLDTQLDRNISKSNQPIHLTIKLYGEGDLQSFKMEDYYIDGVTIYSDDAKVRREIRSNRPYSEWRKQFVLIADHDFVIPKRSIAVFNPKCNRVVSLTIPSFQVKIEGATQRAHLQDRDAGVMHTKSQSRKSAKAAPQPMVAGRVSWWWPGGTFVLGLLVGWLLCGDRWISLVKARKKRRTHHTGALERLLPHLSKDPEVEAMVTQLMAKRHGKKVSIDKAKLKALLQRYEKS